MKRLLSLLASLSFFYSSFSQDYIPFPLENTSWYNGHYQCDDWFQNCFLHGPYDFYTSYDTLINGITMTKILTSHPFEFWLWSGDLSFDQPNNYVGAIREEDNRVYFIPWFQETEELLFDFTLQVGDTVAPYAGGWDVTLEVADVSYEEFDGVMRKVIHFENGYNRWIEGIGSDRGIFYQNLPNLSGYYTYQECVRINGEIVFSHEEGEFNCTLLSTDETTEDFQIFPNPASNYFNVEGFQGNALLELRDLQGRLIQSENVNSVMHRVYLDNQINLGMYLVRIYSGSKQFTQRLLIQ